jgi:hypothetical protein
MAKLIPVILLLGSSAFSQSAQSAAKPPADVAPDTPVITIQGVCDHPSGQKPGPNCKTVITRAQFESMVQTIQPNLPASARRDFAQKYAEALVADEKAREMGIDQGPRYDLHMKIARAQALAQELSVAVAEDAYKVSDKDIDDYYSHNPDLFVEADLTRILVPGVQQFPEPAEKLSDEEKTKRYEASEAVMKDEAERLRTRALAGEDMEKLQSEAFALALVDGKQPPVQMGKTRGLDLPANQVSVMELKKGEVSQPIVERRGYLIYRMGEKRTIPLSEARDLIRMKLGGQRKDAQMDAIGKSATTKLDEVYFGK